MQRSSYHTADERAFEDHTPIQTSDFDFDGMDARLGWTENGDSAPEQPQSLPSLAATDDDDLFDPDKVPIPPQQEGIIKLICLLLASDNTRLELLTLAAAFGLSALIGGKSFSRMAVDAGVTKQAFSRRVIRVQRTFGLPTTRGQKSIAARVSYSKIQKEIWQRPERQPETTLKKLARNFAEPATYQRR